jgi:hypothetical protein
MSKIVSFNQKKELPIEIRERISKLANDYVELAIQTFVTLGADDDESKTEVALMMGECYQEELINALAKV